MKALVLALAFLPYNFSLSIFTFQFLLFNFYFLIF